MGADLVTCVLYTKAVARFPLRQLGFLVEDGVKPQTQQAYKDGVHLGVRNATPAPESHEDLGDFVSCMNCGEYLKEDA